MFLVLGTGWSRAKESYSATGIDASISAAVFALIELVWANGDELVWGATEGSGHPFTIGGV
jgi:hypothetical protein